MQKSSGHSHRRKARLSEQLGVQDGGDCLVAGGAGLGWAGGVLHDPPWDVGYDERECCVFVANSIDVLCELGGLGGRGENTRYRVTATASVNAQPPGGTWTVGVVAVSPTGVADTLIFNPSAFLASVVFTNPGANATTTGASADATMSGSGLWAFCVSNSGTQVNNSAMLLHCQLQVRNT